jgi:site-specific recombinase XerD
LIGIDYEKITINRYDNCMRKLASAIQREYGKEDITFYELSGEFIRKFEIYLKTEEGLCQNTIVRYMKCLKKITNMALANNWMKVDPFLGRKFRQEETNPVFLTMEELDSLIKKRFSIERLEIVRDIFVFCCFTSLAFVDAKELTPEHIFKDNKGSLWIRKGREKMKRRQGACMSNVPLLGIAQQILKKYKDHPVCQAKSVCLPVYSNQKMNSYIKEIADFCGIKKNITSHLARHRIFLFRLKTSKLQSNFLQQVTI